MSGESTCHARLVEKLIERIEQQHDLPRRLILLADHRRFGGDRPPRIGGFLPDVFATDVPTTFRIIGEAKTAPDLESERSSRQLAAFLDHLALYTGSVFYLAVPWFSGATARGILRSLWREGHDSVITHVLPCA